MSQPLPGLDITVHSGGPITSADTTTSQPLLAGADLAQFGGSRVRKTIVQTSNGAIAIGDSGCSQTAGSQNGIYIASNGSYTFDNIDPADIYFHAAATTCYVSYLIEM